MPVLAAAMTSNEVPDDDAAAELAEVEERMAELAEMFSQGDISRAEWLKARKGLEVRQTVARKTLSRQRQTAALDPYDGQPGALRAAWPNLSPDQRRAVCGAIIDRAIVKPATRRGPRFDPDRVDVIWRV